MLNKLIFGSKNWYWQASQRVSINQTLSWSDSKGKQATLRSKRKTSRMRPRGIRAVWDTLCCSVLQCVAVCCSVLQCYEIKKDLQDEAARDSCTHRREPVRLLQELDNLLKFKLGAVDAHDVPKRYASVGLHLHLCLRARHTYAWVNLFCRYTGLFGG